MDPAALQNLTQEQKTAIMAQAQQQANQQIVSCIDTSHHFYQTCIFTCTGCSLSTSSSNIPPSKFLIYHSLFSQYLHINGPKNNINNR